MDNLKKFFDMVDEYSIVVVGYEKCNILYMNDSARDRIILNAKAFEYFQDVDFIHKVIGDKSKVKFRIAPDGARTLNGTLYRMEFMGEDSVVAYIEHGKSIANTLEEKQDNYVIVNGKQDVNNRKYELAIRENSAIVDSLCKEYYSIFIVEADTGKFTIMYSDGSMKEYCEQFSYYDNIVDDYCEQFVNPNDRDNVRKTAMLSNIISKLSVQDIYQITYRMKNKEWRALRYSKIETEDEQQLIMVGVVIFDKDMQEYFKTKNLAEVMNRFAEDFQAIYRVDLRTEHLEVLVFNLDENDIVYATKNNFEQQNVYISVYVDPDFREELRKTISYKALKTHFDKSDEMISCNYCEISGKWINMRIAKDTSYSKDNPCVIFAIRECTEEIEADTRKVISETALSKVFISSIIIDPVKDTYELLYDFNRAVGINKKGKFSLLEKIIKKYIIEEDYDNLSKLLEDAKTIENGFVEREFRSEDKDGNMHFFGGMATRVQLQDGNKILVLIMDNDERVANKASYISLNKEYDMTRNVLYTLGDDYFGLYYFDFGVGIIKTLRLPVDMCDIFEVSQKVEDFTDVYIRQMVHEEDRDAIRQCFSRTFIDSMVNSGKDRIFCEFRRLIDNEYRWVRLDIKAIKIENGQTLEAVYAMKDISVEREQELKRNKELMDIIVAANKANQAKSVFLSNMSHDIRTPLNAIIGMTDIAINHVDNSQRVYNNLQKIKSSGKILLYLINNILDMSYIESGKIVINEEQLSLAELFHAVVAMVQAKIKEKHLNFKAIAKNVDNEIVLSDRSTLNKIIINLLGNSIKYTKDYGEIGLVLEQMNTGDREKSLYRIQISDTGVGMSEEFVKRMFEPFEREKDTTMSGVEGTGLGMSITKQLIDLMGGTITVKSELNVGTVIKVDIPLKHTDECIISDVRFDEEEYKLFYIENDRGIELSRIRNYVNNKEGKEIIVISSYDKEEYAEEFEKLGIDKFICEPVFKSDIVRIMNKGRERFRFKRINKNPLKGKKVLIVEDNEINIDIISDYLDDVDIVHESVRNGLDAYNLIIKDHSFDCVLMDVRMPVMGGYEATGKIREYDDEYTRTVPIIAMTANAFAEDVQKSKSAGMNDHITKPVDPEIFYDILKKYIVAD